MNRHKATTLEHHVLRESLLVMSNIVQREAAEIWREWISRTIIRLMACQLSSITQKKINAYNADGALEGDGECVLLVTLMNIQALVGVEVRDRLAKVDAELVLCSHFGDFLT
jgi:hypothetical protein